MNPPVVIPPGGLALKMGDQCPKCSYYSGDDWQQCQGACPVARSPHFRQDAMEIHRRLQEFTKVELEAENRLLREALKPFAEAGRTWLPSPDGDVSSYTRTTDEEEINQLDPVTPLTVGMVRAAAKVVFGEPNFCRECGGPLGGTSIGRIESHKPNCSRFPL